MSELVKVFALGTAFIFVTGYLTPKFIVWGGIATLSLALSYAVIPDPAYSSSMIITDMAGLLVEILWIYPKALWTATLRSGTEYGILGLIVSIGYGVLMVPVYLFGVFLGLVTWPEILILRMVL